MPTRDELIALRELVEQTTAASSENGVVTLAFNTNESADEFLDLLLALIEKDSSNG